MPLPDTTWVERTGRDNEGDKFSRSVYVHGSGRILAVVCCPINADEYQFIVFFYCEVPDEVLLGTDFRFISLESGQTFVETILGMFNPFAGKAVKPVAVVATSKVAST